jgi:hypothetical protein
MQSCVYILCSTLLPSESLLSTIISTRGCKQSVAIVEPLLCGVNRLIAPTQSGMRLNNVSANRKQGQSGHNLVFELTCEHSC